MKSKRPEVLLLGARAPAALELARRFSADGWRVQVADSGPCRSSAWSNAVARHWQVAPPRFAPARFIADLDGIVRRERVDLLIPTCEEVFYLSRYRAALPRQLRVLADDFPRLRALHSKWQCLALACQAGVPVPDGAAVRTLEQAREWAAGAPLVLKPEYSRFGVHVRLYPDGLPANAPALEVPGTWVAQRYCQGQEICSYSVADKGRLLAHTTYLPRYRLHGSSSYYFDPFPSPRIEAAVRGFVHGIGFSGQISFDWIIFADGTPHMIECNPRTTSGVHLFAAEEALTDALVGAADTTVAPMPQRARMISSLMLSSALPIAIRRGAYARWRDDFRRASDVIAVAGDPAPLAGGIVDLASMALSALRNRTNLRRIATHDIEWDGVSPP